MGFSQKKKNQKNPKTPRFLVFFGGGILVGFEVNPGLGKLGKQRGLGHSLDLMILLFSPLPIGFIPRDLPEKNQTKPPKTPHFWGGFFGEF